MGPNETRDEKNLTLFSRFYCFLSLCKKLESSRDPISRTWEETLFSGHFGHFAVKNPPLWTQIKYAMKKFLTLFSRFDGTLSLWKILESFHKPILRKWYKTMFSGQFGHFRAKNPPLWAQIKYRMNKN